MAVHDNEAGAQGFRHPYHPERNASLGELGERQPQGRLPDPLASLSRSMPPRQFNEPFARLRLCGFAFTPLPLQLQSKVCGGEE